MADKNLKSNIVYCGLFFQATGCCYGCCRKYDLTPLGYIAAVVIILTSNLVL